MPWILTYEPERCAGCGEEFQERQPAMMAVMGKSGKFGTCHYPDCLEGFQPKEKS